MVGSLKSEAQPKEVIEIRTDQEKERFLIILILVL
jgi:hypothetical protein